jgi:hypothetical protein
VRQQVRWNRFQQVFNGSGKQPKWDTSPKVFFRVMRWEVLVIFASLSMGLLLPTIFKKRYEWDKSVTKNQSNSNDPFSNPRGDVQQPLTES